MNRYVPQTRPDRTQEEADRQAVVEQAASDYSRCNDALRADLETRDTGQPILTLAQAARFCDLSEYELKELIAQGAGPECEGGLAGKVLFRRAPLEQWKNDRERGQAARSGLMTIDEFARAARITTRYASRLCRENRVRSVRLLGNGQRLIPADEVARVLIPEQPTAEAKRGASEPLA